MKIEMIDPTDPLALEVKQIYLNKKALPTRFCIKKKMILANGNCLTRVL